MKVHQKSFLPITIIIGLFFLIYFVGAKVPETTIREVIKNAGPLGVIILILLLWSTNIIAPLSGSPFLYAGFYLYGQMVVIYAFIAAVIASITNFWIARIWGRPLAEKLAGNNWLDKIDKLTSNYGLQTLIIFRLFLKEFHDVISYAFGLTKMKFKTYFAVSILGMLPATIIWYFIALKIHSAFTFTAVSWIFAYISLTAYILWIKLRRKQKIQYMKKKLGIVR